MDYAESFRDLIVYQKSQQLSLQIFNITKGFPREERYSLIDQIRRSSRSIGAQIAEAWARRGYERHFLSKLADADGEQLETQHWVDTARDCQYLSPDDASQLIKQCQEIGRLLNGMMKKSHLFCQRPASTLRESTAEYFATPES